MVESKWPRFWRLLNNRPARLLLLVVAIVFLAKDYRDTIAVAPPPNVTWSSPPPPMVVQNLGQYYFDDLKKQVASDAGNAKKIKEDFDTFRLEAEPLWPQGPARSLYVGQYQRIEDDFVREGNDRTAVLEGLLHLRFEFQQVNVFQASQKQKSSPIPDVCHQIGIVGGTGTNSFDGVKTENADCGIIAPGKQNIFKNTETTGPSGAPPKP